METFLRSASPEDGDAAVPLIYSSGPAAFDYVFADSRKGSAQDFLRYAFRHRSGEFGHGVHTVVVSRDGSRETVVGIGVGFDGFQASRFLLPALRQILGFYGPLRCLGVIRRGLAIEKELPPPVGALQYIGHLGVSRDWRGRGLGTRLLEHFIDLGRSSQCAAAALDVSVENPRAEALYAREGFEVTGERASKLRRGEIRVPGHRRMEKQL